MPALQKPTTTRKGRVAHSGVAGEVTGLSVDSSLTSHLRSVMGLMLKSLTRPRSWYICSKQLSICGNRARGERSGRGQGSGEQAGQLTFLPMHCPEQYPWGTTEKGGIGQF